MRMLICLLVTTLLMELNVAIAQTSDIADAELPKVFLLGEYESQYNQLIEQYEISLLTVCKNDMPKAFKKWMSMNQEIEVYANQIEFDMNGLRLWLHIFWEKDGTIKHIGYHLRPNSRNIQLEDLTAFFSSFCNHYKFPLTAETGYQHYSFAQFPMVSQRN